MKRLFIFILSCILLTITSALSQQYTGSKVVIVEVNSIISPATADYITRSFDKANTASTEFILVKLDTPGGLDLSMRKIIKTIIESPIPIVTYVSPGGARAASAGTYILYASHIAAMSPGTNLGAATPVQLSSPMAPTKDKPRPFDTRDKDKNKEVEEEGEIVSNGDAMTKKVVNDAVAYIQSLAKMRGRNEVWAEKAVRDAASLPAQQALEMNVVDIVATNQGDLFRQLNGRTVNIMGKDHVLNTDNITIELLLPDWRNKLLETITNPNIAYILMLIGIYGLIFEFSNPGAIVSGTVGSICLLLALFAFQVLPINYAGLALIALGVAFLVAEAFQPSFGVLGIGGVIAFATGSVILIDTDIPGYGIDIGVIAGFTISTAAFFILALGLVFKARRNPIVSGYEQMIGAPCEAIEDFNKEGRVHVHSEVWMAQTGKPIKKGQKAKVIAIDGLTVEITPE